MPAVPAPATGRTLAAARFAIFVTIAGWLAFLATTLSRALLSGDFSIRTWFDAIVYITVVTLLTGSALAYLIGRLGFLYRSRTHHRIPRAALDAFFCPDSPTLTVLVPSYREEASVVRQTLLSAALQEHPHLEIVLLVDDPPNPSEEQHHQLLAEARALPGQIAELLRAPRERFQRALGRFETAGSSSPEATGGDMYALASEYDIARSFLSEVAGEEVATDHSEEFLRSEVVLRLAEDLGTVADALRRASDEGARLTPARMLQLYRRLAWTFSAKVTSFERKRYASLSHEPNKAMNLNSYLGLMGGRYREHRTSRGPVLSPTEGAAVDLDVRNPDYVLTLDADSVLLPEYCMRLVYLLEQPEFERVAVAQTPYSSFPGARTRIERIAGATTDIQHLVHQGLTYYGATFWVGANAVLRKRALDEIVETGREGGHLIRRYIQDRTVIEDTDSSIDLAAKGWALYNYPERLSYSATPPDFGSLCIQRQRWANGGLLIFGKFRRYAAERRKRVGFGKSLAESFLRTNYLASIAWASLGLIVLLIYPISGKLLTPIALAAVLPYFVAMASDLKRCGYKRTDAARMYGFNLILLPVNVSGALKSVVQAIGGQKTAFARTPKVGDRTVAPTTFVLVPYVIVAFSVWTIWRDLQLEQHAHAAYAAVNAILGVYAVVAFIGIRYSIADIWVNLAQRLYRPGDNVSEAGADELDWVAVLYDGAESGADALPAEPFGSTVAAAVAMSGRAHEKPDAVARVTNGTVEPLASGGGEGDGRNGAAHGTESVGTSNGDPSTVRPAPLENADARAGLGVALSECLRGLRDGERLVLRVDGGAVEVVVKSDASK